ncbi:hypothetical protein [Roseomonas elaeocarpi]|uniref:Uncharacterized protein n=1 Tax=Roseomonas elaeocarpi TaxID=907779 RepID=A0ABV6K089_9PROT
MMFYSFRSEPRMVVRYGPQGGPVWNYRGALIETGSIKNGRENYLRMKGHPENGERFDYPMAIVEIVDWWIDEHQCGEAP